MKVTIADGARMAGVSTATVDRVVNSRNAVNPDADRLSGERLRVALVNARCKGLN